jgi:hypothetical protein
MTDTPDTTDQETEKNVSDSDQSSASGDVHHQGATFTHLDRIKILCNSQLKQYSKREVKAYEATSIKAKNESYIAFVCERHLTPRLGDIENYESIINPALIRIVSKGVVYWPPSNEERFVIVYQNNIDKPLLQKGGVNALGLKQDNVVENILKPFIGVLLDFRDKEFVHGSIRAGNLFNTKAATSKNIVLGDCLTAPSGCDQSVLYETIPRAMCDPIARGKGTIEDDIYALGVSIAILMRTSDFHAKMSDEEIIRRKVEDGSYSAITGSDRFKGSILEFLRGALHDDPDQRWNVEDIQAWLDGIRLSPKQTRREKKAPRPFELGGRSFFYLSSLAMELDKYPEEVLKVIEDESLCQWIERSLDAPAIVERVNEVVVKAKAQGAGKGYVNRLVSYLSVALDDNSPLRFEDMRLNGEGVGVTLTKAIVKGEDLKVFSDLFLKEAIFFWLSSQVSKPIDIGSFSQKFDKCKRALVQRGIGQGIERCAYILNSQAHCMSPRLNEFYILRSEDFLPALEKKAKQDGSIDLPVDRHVAAFLIEHDSKLIDAMIYDLNSDEYHRVVVGNLKVMAAMQKRYNIGDVPHLSKALAPYFSAVYKKTHDKLARDKLKLSIDKGVKKGDLNSLLQLLDNQESIKRDHKDFMAAFEEYKLLKAELENIEEGMKNRSTFQRARAGRIGSIVACGLSGLIILIIAMTYF